MVEFWSIYIVNDLQWRSQGLPGWATRLPRGPKWGRKWVKVWAKIRKLYRDLRKKWGKWNSCPHGTERLAPALIIWSCMKVFKNLNGFTSFTQALLHLGWKQWLTSSRLLSKLLSFTTFSKSFSLDKICMIFDMHVSPNKVKAAIAAWLLLFHGTSSPSTKKEKKAKQQQQQQQRNMCY